MVGLEYIAVGNNLQKSCNDMQTIETGYIPMYSSSTYNVQDNVRRALLLKHCSLNNALSPGPPPSSPAWSYRRVRIKLITVVIVGRE